MKLWKLLLGAGFVVLLAVSANSQTIDRAINRVASLTSTGSILSSSASAGVGYTTGAGGAVTQITSRTTGVTLNTINGEITLVSAAGSTTAASFTVTNSAMGATDHVVLNQKSGANKYVLLTTAKAAGSFEITLYTTGGIAVEAPVVSFAIVKGTAS